MAEIIISIQDTGAIHNKVNISDPVTSADIDINVQMPDQDADIDVAIDLTGGKPGKDGGYYVPNVADDGTLTWNASNPDMPPVSEANLKGPAGEKGDDGPAGITPRLAIGIVDTLPAGSEATVTITGTSEDPVLNFGVPKGHDGLDAPIEDGNYFLVAGEDEGVRDYFLVADDTPDTPDEPVGNITPDRVIFPNGAYTTYVIGKVQLVNGIGTLIEPGGNLTEFFEKLVDEKNPTITEPSVSLSFPQAKAYEAGTSVTPTYSAGLSAGSYEFGPATGITATGWTVTDTNGNSRNTASGSFPALTATDGMSYKITAKADHGEGAIPVTNTGNSYEAGRISAGSKSATSGAISAYRNTFYGTLTEKTALTSSVVRGLTGKSGKTLANGASFTVTVPVGALRVVIAYPATLRDVTSIKDVNGLNAEIKSGFTKVALNVEGANGHTAISYKAYIMDFANANDAANKYTVTI